MEWRRYVPVAERRAKARREMNKLRKKGKDIQPIEIAVGVQRQMPSAPTRVEQCIGQSATGRGWPDTMT